MDHAVHDFDLLKAIDSFFSKFALRYGREERFGPLNLYVAETAGALLYARPSGGTVTREAVELVLERQRQLGVPEAFEWIDEQAPELEQLLHEQGLVTERCPLLVLGELEMPQRHLDKAQRLVRLDEHDPVLLAQAIAVGEVAFSHRRARRGPAGAAERDLAAQRVPAVQLERTQRRLATGATIMASVLDRSGPVAVGAAQVIDSAAEITGIGTLPIVRRKGLGSILTATLAAELMEQEVTTIFLTAANAEVARLYRRLGFESFGSANMARRSIHIANEPAGNAAGQERATCT